MRDSEDSPNEEAEHLERIPWAELMEEQRAARPWLPYVAVGVLVGVVGWIVYTQVRSPAYTAVTLPPPATVSNPTPFETIPAVPVEGVLPDPQLYAEADLMALAPVQDLQRIAARAEWFVTDYFTIAGDGGRAEALRAHLPPPASEAAQVAQGNDVLSYVEWARALSVTEVPPDRFEVTVAFRTLVAALGENYQRMPVRAVRVLLAVDQDGRPAILDLPAPSTLPTQHAEASWSSVAIEPPPEVASTALATAAEFGLDPQVVSSSRDGHDWRVVLSVIGEGGVRWPLVVRVADESG